ncbi:hypothetical protein BKA70DRAFT_1130367, partial [Coprinopsis sp. MPI-PUGE-AT-0042]
PDDDTVSACWVLVTSPNSSYVPFPALGIRQLRARANGWCGLEDFGQHPQMIVPGYEYLTCIQTNPPSMLRRVPTFSRLP